MNEPAFAGQRGSDVRSDCWVSFQLSQSGGIEIKLKSRVAAIYGDSIHHQCETVLNGLGVKNAIVEIEDAGALPFTIAARIEAAARRAGVTGLEYLPEMKDYCSYKVDKGRSRRSRLYLPGNSPKFFINAGLHKPDSIILDLEDAVAPAEKDTARLLVRNALRQVNFYGVERMVRINQGEMGLKDLDWIVPHNVHCILIPKVEHPEQVKAVDGKIKTIAAKYNHDPMICLMPIIESAKGGLHAYEIATASQNIIGLAVGLEDYTADIGVQRTNEGRESFWLRSMVVNAARAAGIQPIDTVFSDVSDMEGLRESVLEAKALGFEGKGCIHPRQISIVHEAFAPTQTETDKACRIVRAFDEAEAKGLGVVSLGNKMIDPPVVKRALKTVDMATSLGLLPENWREGKENG